jgi:DNA-binding response OmpR family regulator
MPVFSASRCFSILCLGQYYPDVLEGVEMKILVVDDDLLIGDILVQALSDDYKVELVSNGRSGLEMALGFDFDLIILDVMLPELGGIEFCRTLRIKKQTPVLLLTGKDSHQDRLIGFEAGADDYVCKPFDLRELLARVHALMRRESGIVKMPTLRWGIITVTVRSKQVLCSGTLVGLTTKEYDILELFLRNPSQVFSRTAILNRLWTSHESPGEETISTHIKCIRKKLRDRGSADPIETIYGRGYCLRSLPLDESIVLESYLPGTGLSEPSLESADISRLSHSLPPRPQPHSEFQLTAPAIAQGTVHLLIFDRKWQAELLQQQASHWGLVADIASHDAIVDRKIRDSNPAVILFNLASYETTDESPEPLSLLHKLRCQLPQSPILVITHGRVGDRLFLAGLGGCRILDVAWLDFWPLDGEPPSPTLFQEILLTIHQSQPQFSDPSIHSSWADRVDAHY